MEQARKLHPLIGAAALSVIGVSLAGIAVLTGVLPHPSAAPAATSVASAPASAPVATADLVGAATASPEKIPAAQPDAPRVEPAHPATPKHRAAAPKKAVLAQAPAAASAPSAPPPPAGIAPPPPPPAALPAPEPVAVAAAPKPACADCGTVENFREVQVKGEGSPLGAIAGGAGGAILGHQFGRGSGKDLLTIAGAIGGAFAGHEIEKNVRKKTRYEISVRMEDGSLRTLTQDAAPAWRIGERVRVVENRIVAST